MIGMPPHTAASKLKLRIKRSKDDDKWVRWGLEMKRRNDEKW